MAKKYLFELQNTSANSIRSNKKIVEIDYVARLKVAKKVCICENLICLLHSTITVPNLPDEIYGQIYA